MARVSGDIWPQASGSSSLGVEQTGLTGFGREIRPYSHIHMNSGVWHSELGGGSGILRFNHGDDQYVTPSHVPGTPGFDFSIDGGLSFPIRIGGSKAFQAFNVPFGIIDTPSGGFLLMNAGTLYLESEGLINLSCPTVMNLTAGTDIGLTTDDLGFSLTNQLSISAKAIQSSTSNNTFFGITDINSSLILSTPTDSFVMYSDGMYSTSDRQIQLSVFTNSGIFEYRFGPHQSWYIKTSHDSTGGPFNDGFWPIAHSGNVAQMIAQSAGGSTTLQQAYVAGRSIITRSNEGGAVRVSGLTAPALRLEANEEGFPHLAISGLLRAPTSFSEQGEMVLMRHGLNLNEGIMSSITSQGFIGAKSLGIPTLWMHCGGSGIAAVRTASGIAQFFTIAASSPINEVGLNAPFIEASQSNPDRFYRSISNSGIQVLVPGLYKVLYSASAEKTAGELEQQVNVELRLSDRFGQTFRVLGGSSYATVRDSATAYSTANGQCVFDINPGEVINVFGYLPNIPVAPNSVRFQTRAVNIILEYLGPQRGIGLIRQKVS